MTEPERADLRDAVLTLLDRHDGAAPWDVLSGQIGAPGLLVPERYGGAGAGLREACVVAEELGARLVPSPYLSTGVLAPGLLLAIGDERACAAILPGLADGSRVAAVAWPPGGPVPDAAEADVLLVPDGGAWFVDRADAAVEELPPLDLTRPLARVRLGGARGRRLHGDARRAEERLTDLACTALAAEQVGGAAHYLNATVAHVRSGWLTAIAAMPPSSRIRPAPAASMKPGTSHSRLPAGVRTSRPRCPMPNDGRTPTPNRSGSCSRTTTACPAASSSSVVHACPPGGRYCRSSAQIAQTAGGSPVSSCCTPQVAQTQYVMPETLGARGTGPRSDHGRSRNGPGVLRPGPS